MIVTAPSLKCYILPMGSTGLKVLGECSVNETRLSTGCEIIEKIRSTV